MERGTLSGRASVLILVGIMIIATFIRLYGLDRQSLWYDEIFQEKTALHYFSDNRYSSEIMDTSILYPLHIIIINPIIKNFPDSDFALRLPSLIFGVISIPLLFLLGYHLINKRVGLIASFLLAISPFHIWYSQEARMYTLQWMLILISLIYFLKTLEHPKKLNFIIYIISTVAGLYAHQLTIFLLLIQGLYLLLFIRKYKEHFSKLIGAFILVVILYVPLLALNWTTLTNKNFAFPRETSLAAIPYTIFTYSNGFSVGPSLGELRLNQSMATVIPYFMEILPIMLICIILLFLGFWALRKDRYRFLLLLLVMFVPIFGMFILSKLLPNIEYSTRHTGTALFAYLILISKGIERLDFLKPKKLGRIIALLALIMLTGFSTYAYYNYHFDKKYHKEDIKGAAAYIKDNIKQDDAVLCIVDNVVFNRYMNKNICSELNFSSLNNIEMIKPEIEEISKERKRLWLVQGHEWYSGRYGYVKEWLDANYKEIKELYKGSNEIANVQIYCYDLTRNRLYDKDK